MMRQTRMAALLCGAVLMLSVQPCETFGGITPVGARAAARARWQGTCARGLEMRTREDERDMPAPHTRRAHLARWCALGLAVLGSGAPAFAEKKKRPSGGLVGENPNAAQDLFTAKFQQGLNKRTGRLYGCQTQTNCVSTAAGKNPTQFIAPWDYTTATTDADEAWESLKTVVLSDKSLTVVEVDDEARYLHATGKSKVPKDGIDDVEFLQVQDEKIFTTRSASRGNFYVYPYQVTDVACHQSKPQTLTRTPTNQTPTPTWLQVPIGDGGYQKQRLQGILAQLGWVELNYNGNGVYSDGCGPNGDKVPKP